MTTSPADEIRAAQERIRMGDSRVDSSLRGALADVLDWAVDKYDAAVTAAGIVWKDPELPSARDFIAEYGVPDEVLAFARAINQARP